MKHDAKVLLQEAVEDLKAIHALVDSVIVRLRSLQEQRLSERMDAHALHEYKTLKEVVQTLERVA